MPLPIEFQRNPIVTLTRGLPRVAIRYLISLNPLFEAPQTPHAEALHPSRSGKVCSTTVSVPRL